MTASEFRIGNFLRQDLERDGLEVVQVGSIWYDNSSECFYINHDEIDVFDPIKLTEKWLLKFGFEKFSHDKGYSLDGDEDERCDEYSIKEFSIMDWGNGFILTSINGKNRIEIKHVHQLQNLYFALTGKELKVKELSV